MTSARAGAAGSRARATRNSTRRTRASFPDRGHNGAVPSAAIIGAGVFGSSLAWWLARAGWDVTLVDQFEPGDARATSGGETRLLRCGHGEDRLYAASAWRARALWRELEAEYGTELLVE